MRRIIVQVKRLDPRLRQANPFDSRHTDIPFPVVDPTALPPATPPPRSEPCPSR